MFQFPTHISVSLSSRTHLYTAQTLINGSMKVAAEH